MVGEGAVDAKLGSGLTGAAADIVIRFLKGGGFMIAGGSAGDDIESVLDCQSRFGAEDSGGVILSLEDCNGVLVFSSIVGEVLTVEGAAEISEGGEVTGGAIGGGVGSLCCAKAALDAVVPVETGGGDGVDEDVLG